MIPAVGNKVRDQLITRDPGLFTDSRFAKMYGRITQLLRETSAK
jgi:hypothetical protein